jgi:ureidoglycolate hydrolase
MKHQPLTAQPLTPETFQAYGQVITPAPDGKPFDGEDAQLILSPGIPRFYIMRLHHRGRQFDRITRHQHCTQCLGAIQGQTWFLGVAPPSQEAYPDLEQLQVFRITGHCFIKLHQGTWHAGPYFDQETIDFYNLELSDTNVTDHFTHHLAQKDGIQFKIVD